MDALIRLASTIAIMSVGLVSASCSDSASPENCYARKGLERGGISLEISAAVEPARTDCLVEPRSGGGFKCVTGADDPIVFALIVDSKVSPDAGASLPRSEHVWLEQFGEPSSPRFAVTLRAVGDNRLLFGALASNRLPEEPVVGWAITPEVFAPIGLHLRDTGCVALEGQCGEGERSLAIEAEGPQTRIAVPEGQSGMLDEFRVTNEASYAPDHCLVGAPDRVHVVLIEAK